LYLTYKGFLKGISCHVLLNEYKDVTTVPRLAVFLMRRRQLLRPLLIAVHLSEDQDRDVRFAHTGKADPLRRLRRRNEIFRSLDLVLKRSGCSGYGVTVWCKSADH
jgi:hypothetical protein